MRHLPASPAPSSPKLRKLPQPVPLPILNLHLEAFSTFINIMKFSRSALLATCLPVATARFVEKHEADAEADNVVLYPDNAAQFLIETAPGETQWVTEEDKWDLRRVSLHTLRSWLEPLTNML